MDITVITNTECSIVNPSKRQSLLGNGAANTPVATQWFSSHVIAAKDKHATTEELLEAVSFVPFVQTSRHYKSSRERICRQTVS
jgi:hypothetical protein